MRSLLISVVMLTLSASLCSAQAVVNSEPTLTVRGHGRAQVPPDHANLTVEVMTKAKSVEDATAAHRQRALRAVSVLREMAADAVEIAQSTFRLGEVRMPPSLSGSREPEAEYQAVTTFELKMTRVAAVDGSITMHRADSSRSAICGSVSQTTILARIQRAKTRSPMPASERQLMRRRPGCSSGTSSKSKTRRRKVQCCLPRKHRRYGAWRSSRPET